MSIGDKAARGAAWVVAASIGGRLVGVLGTLVMTRFVRPEVIGEVSIASIMAMTANLVSTIGIGHYALVKGRGEETAEVTWHATVAFFALGTVALGVMALFGGAITPLLDAPHAAVYVPGMALAFWIRRFGAIPERVLNRQMKFASSALANGLGELTYTVTALALVATGWGGMAIVIGNLAQSTIAVAILVSASGIASWATPTRLRLARFKDMLRFGGPLAVQATADVASRYWDNLLVSHFFGAGATGAYNLAYNLADVPAIQVGEQLAGVLLPSVAELPRERRAHALERFTAVISVIVFPLAIGLAVVAHPLIAWILPANKWQEVAPLLVVLAFLSVFRPITWALSSFLIAESKTKALMFLKIVQVGVLLSGICVLAPFGLRAAAGAVGLAFAASAICSVAIVVRHGVSATRLIVGFVQPLAACGVMAIAAWGAGLVLEAAHFTHPAVQLATKVVVGTISYIGAALVTCPSTSRELIERLTTLVARRSRAIDPTLAPVVSVVERSA